MKTQFKLLLFICLISQISACSFAQLTVRASMPMIEGGMLAVNRETDLQLAEAAMPANIELMEGMLINDPDSTTLRNYAAQAYYGYAYGFVEDDNPQRAAALYRRGLNHALHNLQKTGITTPLLNGTLSALENHLKQLDDDDIAALFWAASNWAKWIDHNRDKPEAIADLSKAVLLMQRVLELDETFFMAGPHIFFGVYYGSRSPMLGGNFALSESHFNKAQKINQQQLLIVDLLQAEYLDRQQFAQADFHQRLTKLIKEDINAVKDMALINHIAKRKAKRLLKMESSWF